MKGGDITVLCNTFLILIVECAQFCISSLSNLLDTLLNS